MRQDEIETTCTAVVRTRTQGTPQGGPLSPLLSTILLDEFDKKLEKRGHFFVRYADGCAKNLKDRVRLLEKTSFR